MRLLLAAALAVIVPPAIAQDRLTVDQSKLYLSSPEACTAAEGGSMLDGDFKNMRLGDNSIQFSEEAYCDLFQVLTSDNSPEVVAIGVCSFGGERFADQFLITPTDARTVTVVSSRNAMLSAIVGGENGPNPEDYTDTFSKCALDDLPR